MNWIDLAKIIGTITATIIALCGAIGGIMRLFFATQSKVDNIQAKLKEKINRIEIELESIKKYDKRIHDLELKTASNESSLNIILQVTDIKLKKSSSKTVRAKSDQKSAK